MSPEEFSEALDEYKSCEEAIRTLEKEDPLTLYYIKKSYLQSINNVSANTLEKIENLKKTLQTETENSLNIHNLRKAVLDYAAKDIISKNDQELLTSINRLEILSTELEMLSQEKALVESEVSSYKTACTQLITHYNKQNEISKKLTVGITNQEEVRLYNELASAETRKIKISEALQRWRESRLHVVDACQQFTSALSNWRTIKDDVPDRVYSVAEEVRDELITALQCIANARFYIRADLPYCSKSEMGVLEKALSYIFIDMNSEERRLHAESCYKAFHNRSVALYAWVDKTIREVIEPESERIKNDMIRVTQQVREVRFRSVKIQFPDVTWKLSDESEDEDKQPENFLNDQESILIFSELDSTQLAEIPKMEEVYGKSVSNLDYKSLFIESLSDKTEEKNNAKNTAISNGNLKT